VIVNIVHSF